MLGWVDRTDNENKVASSSIVTTLKTLDWVVSNTHIVMNTLYSTSVQADLMMGLSKWAFTIQIVFCAAPSLQQYAASYIVARIPRSV